MDTLYDSFEGQESKGGKKSRPGWYVGVRLDIKKYKARSDLRYMHSLLKYENLRLPDAYSTQVVHPEMAAPVESRILYGQRCGTEPRPSPEPKGEKRQFCSPIPILHIELTTWDQILDCLLRTLSELSVQPLACSKARACRVS